MLNSCSNCVLQHFQLFISVDCLTLGQISAICHFLITLNFPLSLLLCPEHFVSGIRFCFCWRFINAQIIINLKALCLHLCQATSPLSSQPVQMCWPSPGNFNCNSCFSLSQSSFLSFSLSFSLLATSFSRVCNILLKFH